MTFLDAIALQVGRLALVLSAGVIGAFLALVVIDYVFGKMRAAEMFLAFCIHRREFKRWLAERKARRLV